MTPAFRVLLFVAAALMLWLVLGNIRRARLAIPDSLFWFFFAAVLVLLAIFPEIAFWASRMLGVESPVNLVYLAVLAVVLWRLFQMTLRISALNTKIEELTQQMALEEHDRRQNRQ